MVDDKQEEARRRQAHALQRALGWSWAALKQVERIHDAEQAALASQEAWSVKSGFVYSDKERHPFFLVEAENHYFAIAASNLKLWIERSGATKSLRPLTIDQSVVDLRNALEHEPEHGPWREHRWSEDETYLGDGEVRVAVNKLADTIRRIRDELLKLEQDERYLP